MRRGQGRTGGPGPWGGTTRRPSHADRGQASRVAMLREVIRAVLRPEATEAQIQAVADQLLSLAA